MASYLLEYRNCSAGTDILLRARGCCNHNYPCDEGEGHCEIDNQCKDGLICGKNNCDKQKFPSTGTRCCQKGILTLEINISQRMMILRYV